MKTLNEFGFSLANSVGRQAEHAFVELAKLEMKSAMAMLFRRDSERNVGVREDAIQSLYVMLESWNMTNANTPITTDLHNVLRSTVNIPGTVRTHSTSPYQYVGRTDGGNGFTFTPFNQMQYINCMEITNGIRYTRADQRIIVFNSFLPKYILIRDIFADPQAVEDVNIGSVGCLTDDDVIPYPADMVELAYQIVLGRYRKDSSNNNQIYVDGK